MVVAGCYNPTIRAGAPCTTDGDCPSTLMCVSSVCGGEAILADASFDDVPLVDARNGVDTLVLTQHLIGDTINELRDAEIWGTNANVNYGDGDHMSIDGDASSLLRFDLTAIPAGATVLSATLSLKVSDAADEAGGTATVHRLREAWIEAEASWLSRATMQGWSVSGARSPSSDATSLVTFSPAALNTTYTLSLPVAVVQEWIDDPAINYGIIVMRGTSLEHVHLGTRESGAWSLLTLDVY